MAYLSSVKGFYIYPYLQILFVTSNFSKLRKSLGSISDIFIEKVPNFAQIAINHDRIPIFLYMLNI